jgi:RNA polymerase sigma factor (sigma-70 family)
MQVTNEIIEGCIKQDRRAQKALYECCYRQFIRLCLRYHTNHEDARFALNNGFLKIIKGLESVEQLDLNFNAWAKRIIVNSLIDDYRRNKNHRTHLIAKETDRELEAASENCSNEGELLLSYQEIMQLLSTIPPISAHVFTLYVIDGYSHKEIGELLEITDGTSKWHLSTARKLLRERLAMTDERNSKIYQV